MNPPCRGSTGSAAALESPLPIEARIDLATVAAPEPVSNTTPEEFAAMVARAKEYINRRGDVFKWCSRSGSRRPYTLPAFALYRSCGGPTRRRSSATSIDFDAFQIVCSSPEILVRCAMAS